MVETVWIIPVSYTHLVEQTDAEKGTATFKYGKSSTTTTDNEGNKTVYHYDDQYRTTSIEYPDGTTCEKTYRCV